MTVQTFIHRLWEFFLLIITGRCSWIFFIIYRVPSSIYCEINASYRSGPCIVLYLPLTRMVHISSSQQFLLLWLEFENSLSFISSDASFLEQTSCFRRDSFLYASGLCSDSWAPGEHSSHHTVMALDIVGRRCPSQSGFHVKKNLIQSLGKGRSGRLLSLVKFLWASICFHDSSRNTECLAAQRKWVTVIVQMPQLLLPGRKKK